MTTDGRMDYSGRNVLVLGGARSGLAAARLLGRLGARVTIYDRNAPRPDDLPSEVAWQTGAHPPPFDPFDRVVASPGVPVAPHPKLIPEVDLAAEQLRGALVGVTGTNGKSTTTVMIGEMLRASDLSVAVGGNLGTALCDLVAEDADWVVAELSSFQLEHAERLRPLVAVLLNLADDHLDRHGSLEAYAEAKARLALVQGPGDTLVANRDDPWARSVAGRSRARVVGFSEHEKLPQGAFLDGTDLVVATEVGEVLRVPRSSLSRGSRTPIANALAAAAAAAVCGARGDAIERVLATFEGLPHRATLCCVRNGVRYVDDSKATNPSAARSSLSLQSSPVVWIAGGRNKGLDFGELASAASRARVVIAIGEAAPQLAEALGTRAEVIVAETLERAIPLAAERARPGDVVLLAPACTSLDQFSSFEERGRRFAELARRLPDAPSQGRDREDEAC